MEGVRGDEASQWNKKCKSAVVDLFIPSLSFCFCVLFCVPLGIHCGRI